MWSSCESVKLFVTVDVCAGRSNEITIRVVAITKHNVCLAVHYLTTNNHIYYRFLSKILIVDLSGRPLWGFTSTLVTKHLRLDSNEAPRTNYRCDV